ncbi:aminopyrimidine aminohydrolase [Synergistales bacterium]|nr:aminopyrimidine aminohydrolase [Synergistales bacterium]
MTEKFSETVFREVQPLLNKIFDHPFNAELSLGTLSRKIFEGYIQQDSLYLVDFARALALAASRARAEKTISFLLDLAQGVLNEERTLHERYFAEYGVSDAAQANRTCLGYTSYLLYASACLDFCESLAALLPCFWIYREVGNHIAKTAAHNNPYHLWIEAYSDEVFSERVDAYVDLVDRAAEESSPALKESMKKHFMTASRFEYFFWDDAYKMNSFEIL